MWAHIAHDVLIISGAVFVSRACAEIRRSRMLDKIFRAMNEGTAEVTKIIVDVKKEDKP